MIVADGGAGGPPSAGAEMGGRHLGGDKGGANVREGDSAVQVSSSGFPSNQISSRTVADLFLPPTGLMSAAVVVGAKAGDLERGLAVDEGSSSTVGTISPSGQDLEELEKKVMATFQRCAER